MNKLGGSDIDVWTFLELDYAVSEYRKEIK